MSSSYSQTRSAVSNSIRLHRQEGFTLIELLVVIAVIALLASMLLPVMNRARRAAKTITCLSQERQLGVASLVYASTHEDILPAFVVWVPAASDYRYSAFSLLKQTGCLSGWDTETFAGWSLSTNKAMLCPEGVTTSFSSMNWPPRQELENQWAVMRNGCNALINTRYGLSARYVGWGLEPTATHYDWNSAHPAWWGTFGGAQLPLGTYDPNYKSVRLTVARTPAVTWLGADNSHADLGLREVAFPHINLARNYSYLDGHAATLTAKSVDGTNWGGGYQVTGPGFDMKQ